MKIYQLCCIDCPSKPQSSCRKDFMKGLDTWAVEGNIISFIPTMSLFVSFYADHFQLVSNKSKHDPWSAVMEGTKKSCDILRLRAAHALKQADRQIPILRQPNECHLLKNLSVGCVAAASSLLSKLSIWGNQHHPNALNSIVLITT